MQHEESSEVKTNAGKEKEEVNRAKLISDLRRERDASMLIGFAIGNILVLDAAHIIYGVIALLVGIWFFPPDDSEQTPTAKMA